MINKLEQKLDREFELLAVTPHVFHFLNERLPFTAITIVDEVKRKKAIGAILNNLSDNMDANVDDLFFPASAYTIKALHKNHIYGVALCSLQDQFNRQRGRIIAKGRLLKRLKEIAK